MLIFYINNESEAENMRIGEIIRKYRKEKNLTQEELAKRIGVSAPAVNKWESGSTMPDISLLAPISRLLGVSLNELLSFREELSEKEIFVLTEKLEEKLEGEDFNDVFGWAKKQIEEYPNCEQLIYNFAAILHYFGLERGTRDASFRQYVVFSYERLLKSEDEKMRLAAADALFNLYYAEGKYEEAEACLVYLSEQNPEKKRKQAEIYEGKGKTEKAYKTYEEILFSAQQLISFVLNSLFLIELGKGDIERAGYFAEKKKGLARLFEMGEYNVFAADMELAQHEKDREKTLECFHGMLLNIESLYSFRESPMYSHMSFNAPNQSMIETIRKNIVDGLKDDEAFSYMKGDARWEELLQTTAECANAMDEERELSFKID